MFAQISVHPLSTALSCYKVTQNFYEFIHTVFIQWQKYRTILIRIEYRATVSAYTFHYSIYLTQQLQLWGHKESLQMELFKTFSPCLPALVRMKIKQLEWATAGVMWYLHGTLPRAGDILPPQRRKIAFLLGRREGFSLRSSGWSRSLQLIYLEP